MTDKQQTTKLVDKFGRHVTYLRMSVTDRCDFRCVYCMSETMHFLPRTRLLTLQELATVGQAFVKLGVDKIRITGGEPLVRDNVLKLFQDLGQLPGLRELVLTTNGAHLDKFSIPLKEAGVKRINISLDSLDAEKFKRITRTGKLQNVLAGIDAALHAGFEGIKINSVILKGCNDNEIVDLVRFAMARQIDISFIEEMPLGLINDHDREAVYYSSDQIRADVEQEMTLIPTTKNTGGPAKYYRIADTDSHIGFISPHSHNFCGQCNRVRVTAEGRLLLCLGQEHSVDLRHILRTYANDTTRLQNTIHDAMDIKPLGHTFDLHAPVKILRHMNVTGG